MGYQERKSELSYPFQDRLSGFERRNPSFISTFGNYELAVCEQAEIIANSLIVPRQFPWWWALSWEGKHRYTPGLDDTITLEALQEAVNLAYALLTNPNLVPQMHGSLCRAVGCQAYGCFSQEEEEEEEENTLWLGLFEDRKDVEYNFGRIPADAEILVAYYEIDGYDGSSFVLFRQKGVLYEVNASHCSCYGLEGQWNSEEVVLQELLNRPQIIPYTSWNDRERLEGQKLNSKIQRHILRVTKEEKEDWDNWDCDRGNWDFDKDKKEKDYDRSYYAWDFYKEDGEEEE